MRFGATGYTCRMATLSAPQAGDRTAPRSTPPETANERERRRLLRTGRQRATGLLVVVAAPEGIRAVQAVWPGIAIFTAAVDRELNPRKFILPGLGDFGDRLYGTE